MIVTLIMVGCLMIVLVSSGGWRVLSGRLGVGDPDASTSGLTGSKGTGPGRNPDARDITGLFDRLGGGQGEDGARPQTGAQSTPRTDGQSTPRTDTDPAVGVDTALNDLDSIPVARPRLEGYDRETMFGGWAASGCGKATTRDTILARDMDDVRKDTQCRVTSGTLHDPYTGRMIRFTRGRDTSMAVQIDHVVALQDAWASGAYKWDQTQRVRYANDPDVLLASDGPANMAKGAGVDFNGRSTWLEQHTGAPDIWMPDDKAYRCEYMARRVTIKAKYRLSMGQREKQETVTFLSACRAGQTG